MSYTIKWYLYKHGSVVENETLNVIYYQIVYVKNMHLAKRMRPLKSYTTKWYMYKHAYVQENYTLNVLYYQMVYVQTCICPREWDP